MSLREREKYEIPIGVFMYLMRLVMVLLVWCEFERFWSINDGEDDRSDEYGAKSMRETSDLM